MFRRWAALAVLAVSLLLPVSASAIRVGKPIHFLRPPQFEMPAYKSIGVAAITGWSGDELEAAIITALLDRSRGLGPLQGLGPDDPIIAYPDHFPIVERSRLDVVLGEKTLSASGLTDVDLRTALGGVMDAGVIITGAVARPASREEWGRTTETEEVEVTEVEVETETGVQVDVESDIFGDDQVRVKVVETDTVTETTYTEEVEVVTEACLTRYVDVRFDLRAIEVTTGRVLAADSIVESNWDYECGETEAEARRATTSADALAGEALQTLAYGVANRIAPYWGTTRLVMERNKRTKVGVIMFKRDDDLAGAAAWFAAEARANPYDEWLQYHAGLFLAATFHFEKAEGHLRAARAVKDRKIFNRLENLIKILRSDYRSLAAMGVPMHPISAPPAESASVEEVVKVRGGRKRMSAIRSTHSDSGATVVMVPGGMELTFLEQQGEWFRVRTFDGKEGWIHADDLR